MEAQLDMVARMVFCTDVGVLWEPATLYLSQHLGHLIASVSTYRAMTYSAST